MADTPGHRASEHAPPASAPSNTLGDILARATSLETDLKVLTKSVADKFEDLNRYSRFSTTTLLAGLGVAAAIFTGLHVYQIMRMDSLADRISGVGERVVGMEGRLDRIDQVLTRTSENLNEIQEEVATVARDVNAIRGIVDRSDFDPTTLRFRAPDPDIDPQELDDMLDSLVAQGEQDALNAIAAHILEQLEPDTHSAYFPTPAAMDQDIDFIYLAIPGTAYFTGAYAALQTGVIIAEDIEPTYYRDLTYSLTRTDSAQYLAVTDVEEFLRNLPDMWLVGQLPADMHSDQSYIIYRINTDAIIDYEYLQSGLIIVVDKNRFLRPDDAGEMDIREFPDRFLWELNLEAYDVEAWRVPRPMEAWILPTARSSLSME